MFNIIGLVFTGLIVGALARLFTRGKQNLSLVATLLLGLAGAGVGALVATVLGTGGIFELNILGFVVAVVASVALVGTAERISSQRAVAGKRH